MVRFHLGALIFNFKCMPQIQNLAGELLPKKQSVEQLKKQIVQRKHLQAIAGVGSVKKKLNVAVAQSGELRTLFKDRPQVEGELLKFIHARQQKLHGPTHSLSHQAILNEMAKLKATASHAIDKRAGAKHAETLTTTAKTKLKEMLEGLSRENYLKALEKIAQGEKGQKKKLTAARWRRERNAEEHGAAPQGRTSIYDGQHATTSIMQQRAGESPLHQSAVGSALGAGTKVVGSAADLARRGLNKPPSATSRPSGGFNSNLRPVV